MDNNRIECSIVITTFNVEKTIRQTLDCIFSSEFNYCFEVIAVDDASTDSTREICKEYTDVELIVVDQNGGPARARNLAIAAARGEYLIFIDSDVEFESDLLQRMMDKMKAEPELSGVGSVSDVEPLNPNFFSRYFAIQEYYLIRSCSEAGITLGICTRCGILKRSLFDEYGGFDERHKKPSIEDYQFSLRIRGEHTIDWDKTFINRHYFPTSMKTLFRRLHRNTREMIFVMKDLKIKDTGPYVNDTRARISIILACCLCLLLPVSAFFLVPAMILILVAACLKRDLLRMFARFHGLGFAIKGWLMYMSICLPLITGTVSGIIATRLKTDRE